MTLRTWLANVSPSGTAMSTSNMLATDGAAASTFAPTTGVWYSTDVVSQSGGFSVRLTPTGSVPCQMRLPLPAGNVRAALSFYHRAASLPPAIADLVNIRHSSGQNLRLRIKTDGAVAIVSSGGAEVSASAAGMWQPNRWNRIEAYWDNSGGASAGTCTLAIYNGESTTAEATVNATGGSFGAATPTVSFDFGTPNAASLVWEQFFDSAQMDDGRTSFIGPLSTNVNPTVTLTGTQNVNAGATVNATATATDPDGSIASYAWSVVAASSSATPTLTNASTATVSFTAPAAGNLVTLQCQVTDNQGATATATTEVRIPAAANSTRYPLPFPATGAAWTRTGSTSDGAALADTNDTTYLESPTLTATDSARRIRLQPSLPGSSAQLVNRLWTDAGTGNTTVRLYEGTTLRQSWTHAITTSPTDYTDTFSAGTISAITDWGNLYVEVGATA